MALGLVRLVHKASRRWVIFPFLLLCHTAVHPSRLREAVDREDVRLAGGGFMWVFSLDVDILSYDEGTRHVVCTCDMK